MTYQSRSTEELLAEARRISNIGKFLPRDVARCPGEEGCIICGKREDCLRYVPDSTEEGNFTYFMPKLTVLEQGCEEYIGDE